MNAVLSEIGLTPDAIKRHVLFVRVDSLCGDPKHREVVTGIRQRKVSSGLTTHGTKRKNRQHPELAGLSRREYQKRYMQMLRNPHRGFEMK